MLRPTRGRGKRRPYSRDMKYSYQWLKELLPDLKMRPKNLSHTLTQSGIEVESVEELGEGLNQVVVGLVKSVRKHPNADRLSLCEVSDGKKIYSIVCGDPAVASETKYPLAKIGAKLPNGMEIKKSVIRDVESEGMLCSASELGLSEESRGILKLDEKAPVGRLFASYYGLADTIIDIAIPPNRGDLLSHWGLAHEVAALCSLSLNKDKTPLIKGSYPLKSHVKVQVKDRRGCPRYCARVIGGIQIAPSPRWLTQRLTSLGVRPVNNVVDATNYVMLETGHPLHAFDHRFLRGGKLIIRKAGSPQKFETLDHEVRDLLPDDLMIADSDRPVALAGIMGGKESEVREDTSMVILEAAAFNPVRIRKTARRLGIQTESSQRFERFVNPDTVLRALDRLTHLIIELAGGKPSRDRIDYYPHKLKPTRLTLRFSRLEQVLGIKIKTSEVFRILKSLGLNPVKIRSGWRLTIPVYRYDLTREIDIIEEVVRIYGYDQIKSELPIGRRQEPRRSSESFYENRVRHFFADRGFFETIHYSFCDPDEVTKTGYDGSFIPLSNPLSREMSVMRPTLLPGLLQAYAQNRGVREQGLSFFELRTVYSPPRTERKRLGGLYGGSKGSQLGIHSERAMNFFDGKGLLESFFNLARIPEIKFEPCRNRPEFHPGQAAQISSRGEILGYFGKIHPHLLAKEEIKESLFYFDLNYSLIVQKWGSEAILFEPVSPFPRIARDMALVMDVGMSHDQILKTIQEFHVPWLKEVSLFDIYKGEKLPPGKKSLAFSLVYENPQRTLTDEEVNQAHFALVGRLKKKLGVDLR